MKETRNRVPPDEVDARRLYILEQSHLGKTGAQIARELGITLRHLHMDVWRMRQDGLDVPFRKQKPPRRKKSK